LKSLSNGQYNPYTALMKDNAIFYRILQHFILFYGLSLCTGCTPALLKPEQLHTTTKTTVTVRPQSLKQQSIFTAQGKLGLKDGKRGGNIRFQWQQDQTHYSIRLFSGFIGQGSVDITGNATGVRLIEANGASLEASNPEDLVKTALHWSIPVSGLRYWLIGLPAPNSTAEFVTYDEANRIWQMKQDGWLINYQSYQLLPNGQEAPYKLQLNNGALSLKFVFTRWSLTN
jgi:outer membrane lipoprotein LolB